MWKLRVTLGSSQAQLSHPGLQSLLYVGRHLHGQVAPWLGDPLLMALWPWRGLRPAPVLCTASVACVPKIVLFIRTELCPFFPGALRGKSALQTLLQDAAIVRAVHPMLLYLR